MHGAGMTRPPSRRARAGRARPPVGIAISLAVALALAGCSWLPDWADPVAAYKAVVGDDFSPTRDDEKPPAGEASFPNLGSVPDQAPATSSAAERQRIVEGLVADRRNARHGADAADQAAAPAPPAPPTAASAAQPGRVAVPSIVQGGPRPIVPPPAGAPRLRSVVPAPPAPSTSVSEPLPAPPAAAPPTVVVLQPPPAAAAAAPPPRDDFATVGQVFAARIAQSGATVTTAPAHLGLSTPAPPADEPPSAEAEVESGSGAAAPAGARPVGPAADPPVIVYFANGSSRIAARERAKVAEVARRYKADGAGAVRIVGHASSRTLNLPIDRHKLVNLWISMDRAEAVARELVRRGVAPDAIVVEARADNEPRFFESMPAAEASNRRAEVYLEF